MRNLQKHRLAVAKGTNRKKYQPAGVIEAVRLVVDEKLSLDWAVLATNVPRETVRRYVKQRRGNPDKPLLQNLPGPAPILTAAEEADLVDMVHAMSEIGCGMTMAQANRAVLDVVADGRVHPFNKKIGPGRDWWEAFLRRQPTLSMRVGEKLERARACNDNINVMTQFMNTLSRLYAEHELLPHLIFNTDETKTEPKFPKVLARKGVRTAYILTPPPLPHTSIVGCINAAGESMPPTIINIGKNIQSTWFEDAAPGVSFASSDSGWINDKIFLSWFDLFVKFVDTKRQPTQKALLIFDGHSSHITIELVKKAALNNILLLQLPPHTTHRVQPLDLSCFFTWHREFGREVHQHVVRNPKVAVNKDTFARMMRPAWDKAMSKDNILAGFKKAGIWPFDQQLFLDNYRKPTKDGQLSPAAAVDLRPSTTAGIPFAPLPDVAAGAVAAMTPIPSLRRKRREDLIDLLREKQMETAILRQSLENEKAERRRDSLSRIVPLGLNINVTNINQQPIAAAAKKKKLVNGAQVLTVELFAQRAQETEEAAALKKAEKEAAKAAAKAERARVRLASKAAKAHSRPRKPRQPVLEDSTDEEDVEEEEDDEEELEIGDLGPPMRV